MYLKSQEAYLPAEGISTTYMVGGAEPFKLRPHRYPHFQKAEIVKLGKEMLEDGVIQLSNSSFASPVLLVKK